MKGQQYFTVKDVSMSPGRGGGTVGPDLTEQGKRQGIQFQNVRDQTYQLAQEHFMIQIVSPDPVM
jgi:hypothetical protein